MLRTKRTYLLLGLVAILALSGCDMKKNTWFNRKHQALNTKYNVYYNANESFKKGYKRIEESYAPDYSHVIPVFAVSDPSTLGTGTGDMNKAVEKCELAVQERSMQKKPKKDYSKMRDPEYAKFYNQEEFNSYMDEVWMLMGRSKFHANDYLAASATFTYVTKHFSGDEKLVTKANIWKARAMKEMEWYYEADEILKRIEPEELDPELLNLYNGAMADLLVAQREYKAALPYLLKAAESEKERLQRTRFNFVAAQIQQMYGNKKEAFELYEKVLKANPPYQMSFNAQIRQTEVIEEGISSEALVTRLQKMAKNKNNEDYLDQIYYAIGNIYLSKKDTAQAIENYKTSIEKSTRNGREKAQTLITLGDLYYERPDYVQAQPCFSEASSLIDHKHDDYERVSHLGSVLDELVQNYGTYKLQDSLLILSTAPKAELTAAINREIAKIIEEERLERERKQKEYEEQKQLELEIENMAVMDQRALGNANESTWYFYVKSTVDKGKLEFRKKFGQRRLEDNWNRRNKSIAVFSEESLTDMVDMDAFAVEEEGDSASAAEKQQIANESNPKRPEYYLKQIPFTDDQKKLSHEQLSEALFNLGVIYDEKLNDYPKAYEAFEEFIKRYPQDPRSADAYYCCYRIAGKTEDSTQANIFRDKLLSEYPDSKYAKILSQPDFRAKLESMQQIQDSLYQMTYAAFLDGKFDTVKVNTAYMEKNFPVSSLMPKFLLLNALSIGKTASKDTFATVLNNLVERYPNSDVTSMAKDIIALINQGNNPEQGSSMGGLMALREENRKEEAAENGVVENKGFTVSFDSPYIFVTITDTTKVDQNKLLYETAAYNFTKFLIKDFDLDVKNGILSVSGLDNYDEALWYINGVIADKGIQAVLYGTDYKYLLITPENLELIGKGYTVEQYEQFYKENIVGKNKRSNKATVELIGEEKQIEEMTTTEKLDVKEGDDLNGAKTVVPAGEPAKTEQTAPANNTAKEEKVEAVKETSEQKSEPKEEKSEKEASEESQKSEAKPQAEVAPTPEGAPQAEPVKPATEQPKKELKKYKGLYTYDPSAPHYFVILINKGQADASAVTKALDEYNKTNQALLNLKTEVGSSKAFPQMFIVGELPSSEIGMSYLTQMVKSASVKNALGQIPYRNIVISKDNLQVLKESGNIDVYMELYKRLYLKR